MLEARVYLNKEKAAELRGDGLAALADKLFATVPEAAAVLRSDPRTVRRSIAAGDIPAVPVGPRKLVPVAWLRQAAGLETGEDDY
jgi:hypothetical protein